MYQLTLVQELFGGLSSLCRSSLRAGSRSARIAFQRVRTINALCGNELGSSLGSLFCSSRFVRIACARYHRSGSNHNDQSINLFHGNKEIRCLSPQIYPIGRKYQKKKSKNFMIGQNSEPTGNLLCHKRLGNDQGEAGKQAESLRSERVRQPELRPHRRTAGSHRRHGYH